MIENASLNQHHLS